ncbi:histone deacetylase [Candidatus Bathyarchaeota archaeon]|nr:MAG: histone deacetylase [Candidatus Bathyarchaeota archaeon]
MKTGVFFHEVFSQKDWPIIGNKFKNFPKVMEEVLKLPNVVLFKPKPVAEELLLKVHTKGLVESTKSAWYYDGASISVGGCVEAAEKIWLGEITNALVFDVAAGHHAGPSSAWGGTYLSCTGPTIVNLREKFNVRRFAILDTDSHHGDGTRAVFMGDKDVLHVCFCSRDLVEDEGTKIDVNVGWESNDEEYLKKVETVFFSQARNFKPSMVIHLLGHDTCIGDYGDRNLTKEFYPKLVKTVKDLTLEICNGRYLVVTHGGARRDVAEYIFPEIIKILAKD